MGVGGSTSLIPNLGYLWSSIQTRREGGSIATEFRLLECEWISNIGTYIHPHTLSGSGHVLQVAGQANRSQVNMVSIEQCVY